ncbi:MAG: tol-pal system protein YbgF [Gallionellales bacterium GWA2_60_18]|nr:MAG: tol-pal system protein YbgF [Gallionellales bacterium GWA2_60_18]
MKCRVLLLLALCFAVPAQAGLFSDDEARERIRQLEAQVKALEESGKLQTKSVLDLQTQIEVLNGELRKLRGQNEELAHGLQDAEKREKDFYVDLDTRLRHFETREEAAAVAPPEPAPIASSDPFDPVAENRAFEAAYALFKGGKHAEAAKAFQEFAAKYPQSVHLPNAYYWQGSAQFALGDYKAALAVYQGLLKSYPSAPRAADTLFGIAGCQQEMKQGAGAQKTLKQLVAKYPSSEAAAKAKKLLAAKK